MKLKNILFILTMMLMNTNFYASNPQDKYNPYADFTNFIENYFIYPCGNSNKSIIYPKANGQIGSCAAQYLKYKLYEEYNATFAKQAYIMMLISEGYIIPHKDTPRRYYSRNCAANSLSKSNHTHCGNLFFPTMIHYPQPQFVVHNQLPMQNKTEQPKLKSRSRGPEYSPEEKNNIQLEMEVERFLDQFRKPIISLNNKALLQADKANASSSKKISI